MPVPYSQEWLRLPLGYVSSVAAAVEHVMWWDDPFDPRDATILLEGGDALVWDEESGWRRGRFVSGERGVRTVLAGVRYLGGGVLPEPAEVAALMARGGGRTRVAYRSFRDLHDGFDARLGRHALV
ncbi:DUF6292 family protein [Nonomuraea sp. NPDC050547]|uniref:DUF6292 family protein n=1 Tax=unclassified Nonomuraea TaxID=2593643 RepID=UPI00378A3296